MTESAALLVDEVFPQQPIRQWVLSFPYSLRYLFAARPESLAPVLRIVYRAIAAHLIGCSDVVHGMAHTGAVTLIQRFGSTLNLNVHLHMLFLDGAYVERADGGLRFRWARAPTMAQIARLTDTIARRVCRSLARHGWLERDADTPWLTEAAGCDDPMAGLRDAAITYRIALGPWADRKVVTLQTLPADEDPLNQPAGKIGGFSLHAGVAARANERGKLERLCRYISRPAISEKRLSLTADGRVRYSLKTPYLDGTVRNVEAIEAPEATRRIMEHFGKQGALPLSEYRPKARALPLPRPAVAR